MTKIIKMKKSEYERLEADKLRKQWADHPPDGYTADEILRMPDYAVLDMAYFLSEFDADDERPQEEPEVIIQLIDDIPDPFDGPY